MLFGSCNVSGKCEPTLCLVVMNYLFVYLHRVLDLATEGLVYDSYDKFYPAFPPLANEGLFL